MAVDRKRRLTAHEDDLARRRSTNGPVYGQGPGGASRWPMAPPPATRTDFAMSGAGSRSSNVIDLSSPERPLPRRPSAESTLERRRREYILPQWQPDSEVSKCPICGTQFSFWYRKHHCRKCGRVVCASCSPHRITIPRQFIVHPPVDAGGGVSTARMGNIEVIDLTGDGDDAVPTSPTTSRYHAEPRSPGEDRTNDSALGGGQEVRLCNPCVPDPNPLPPPAYNSHISNTRVIPPSFNQNGSQSSVPPGVVVNRQQRPLPPYSRPQSASSVARDPQSRPELPLASNTWSNLDGSAFSRTHDARLEAWLRSHHREDSVSLPASASRAVL